MGISHCQQARQEFPLQIIQLTPQPHEKILIIDSSLEVQNTFQYVSIKQIGLEQSLVEPIISVKFYDLDPIPELNVSSKLSGNVDHQSLQQLEVPESQQDSHYEQSQNEPTKQLENIYSNQSIKINMSEQYKNLANLYRKNSASTPLRVFNKQIGNSLQTIKTSQRTKIASYSPQLSSRASYKHQKSSFHKQSPQKQGSFDIEKYMRRKPCKNKNKNLIDGQKIKHSKLL